MDDFSEEELREIDVICELSQALVQLLNEKESSGEPDSNFTGLTCNA